MWNALKSVFQRLRDRDETDPVFEEVKGLVESLLLQDFSHRELRAEQDPQVIEVLERLDKEVQAIRQQATGYPEKPIAMAVWLNGTGYADLCRRLTLHFREADWLHREENASALWASATLAVCSHYRHMVGPAMLANADCQQRLGNADRAATMYGAVVSDFELLLDGDYSDGQLGEDERTALESLQTALTQLLGIGTNERERARLEQMLTATNRLLA